MDLNLLKSRLLAELGFNELIDYSWERNATVARGRYMPAIVQFLGYEPLRSWVLLRWRQQQLGLRSGAALAHYEELDRIGNLVLSLNGS